MAEWLVELINGKFDLIHAVDEECALYWALHLHSYYVYKVIRI
jgi:hypothetical protein